MSSVPGALWGKDAVYGLDCRNAANRVLRGEAPTAAVVVIDPDGTVEGRGTAPARIAFGACAGATRAATVGRPSAVKRRRSEGRGTAPARIAFGA
jgi:hypothetical protein